MNMHPNNNTHATRATEYEFCNVEVLKILVLKLYMSTTEVPRDRSTAIKQLPLREQKTTDKRPKPEATNKA